MIQKYPEIPSERLEDLHNLDSVDRSELVLFMAGNQFMVMPELIDAFQNLHPDIENIYYETLPPGLELKQILAGGAIFRGKSIVVSADIYSAVNVEAMENLEKQHFIAEKSYFSYLHNRLTLMVPSGNPAGIESVADLGKEDIRISQPDPENEDIAHHIINMYRQVGGEELVQRIMDEKVVSGTTVMTTVHHRETPLRIKDKIVDVGPVWATEAVSARKSGLAFDVVEPGKKVDQRDKVNYYICGLENGKNKENAVNFLQFIKSRPAQKIYEQHGFIPGFG